MYCTYFAIVRLFCFSTVDLGQPLFFYLPYVYSLWVHSYLVLFHCCVAEASSMFIHVKCVSFTHGFSKCLCLSPWATMTHRCRWDSPSPISWPRTFVSFLKIPSPCTITWQAGHPKPDVEALQPNSDCFTFYHRSSQEARYSAVVFSWFSRLDRINILLF